MNKMNKENAALLLGCQVDASCEDILQVYNLQRSVILAKYDPDPIQQTKYSIALENLELAFRTLYREQNPIPSPGPEPLPTPIKPVDDNRPPKSPKKINSKKTLMFFASFLIGVLSFVFLQSLFKGRTYQEQSCLQNSEAKTNARTSTTVHKSIDITLRWQNQIFSNDELQAIH